LHIHQPDFTKGKYRSNFRRLSRLHWAADGDHDLKPRKASGRTAEQNWAEALDALDGFFRSLA